MPIRVFWVSLFFGLVGLFGRPSPFFPRPSGLFFFGFGFVMSRARTFPCTVSVDVSGLAAQGSSRPDVVSAIVDQFGTMPIAAVQFFGTEAKVTFERQEHKRSVMQHQSVCIRGVDCDIRGGGPRPQNVLIYNFPFEIGHDVVKAALSFFGDVEYVRFRHWTHLTVVCDGVRTVRMVRTQAIPRNLIIDGFPVKVSYVGQEPECDICGKKGHIARSCDMRGKCMECKQPGHFQRNCPVRRRRLANPDLDLPEVGESVVSVPGMPESASAGAATVVVDSAPAGLPAEIPDGAGSSEAGDASSQAVSQSILAGVSAPCDLSESVDSRDNQLDELVSLGSIGAGTNCSDSLFGAVITTPNSNLSGDHPPNSDLSVVNVNKSSDNAISNDIANSGNSGISKDIVNSESSKSGNSGISNDIVNSESNMNDDSNVSVMQSNNDISSVDNDEVNENVYETSSEGLLSDEDSGDNDSDDEDEPGVNVPSANIVSPGSSLSGLSGLSGSRPPQSRLPVAVGKGSSTTISSKIPKVPGAGVRKASSSRPAGLSLGMPKAAEDWGELSQRRR